MGANATTDMPLWERTPASVQWRLLLYAIGATLLVFAGLPLMEVLKHAPVRGPQVRLVDTIQPPPPPPRAARAAPVPKASTTPRVVPQFTEKRATIKVPMVDTAPHLSLAARPMTTATGVAFPVTSEGSLTLPMDGVFDVTEADSPPRPIVRMTPIYPSRARLRRIEGDVQVEFVVAVDGTVRDGIVVQANPADVFEQAALQAIQHWRFDPGLKDGQPVAVRVRQKLSFKLED